MHEPASVLICEDAPGFALLLKSVFGDGGFTIAGIAEDWPLAEEIAATRPDVILVDLWLPTYDPDAMVRIRAAAPAALLTIVSSLSAEEATEMVKDIAGIDLILSKRDHPASLVAAVRERLPR